MNPLQALQGHGQSVWLDYIRRRLLTRGELTRLIEEDGLRGVTSNPAIFEKAITGSSGYVGLLHALAPQYQGAKALYEQVAIRDIQEVADVLRRVYEQAQRRDGYVSLEVSPSLARDSAGTLAEARRLWRQVDRPNVMIKQLESAPDAAQDAAVEALATAGQPVVRMSLADPYQLGAEMFRWQIAPAVAGAIIGINPFNQPDVEASKVATRKLTAAYEKTGVLPAETPSSRLTASSCSPMRRIARRWCRRWKGSGRWRGISRRI